MKPNKDLADRIKRGLIECIKYAEHENKLKEILGMVIRQRRLMHSYHLKTIGKPCEMRYLERWIDAKYYCDEIIRIYRKPGK